MLYGLFLYLDTDLKGMKNPFPERVALHGRNKDVKNDGMVSFTFPNPRVKLRRMEALDDYHWNALFPDLKHNVLSALCRHFSVDYSANDYINEDLKSSCKRILRSLEADDKL